MTGPAVRSPRNEAATLLPDGYEARVLEPSPPADSDPDWQADDPTDRSGATGTVVSPTSDGDLTWDVFAADHPEVAGYARDHWLGARSRLGTLPASFQITRDALHRVAFFALAPRRFAVTGKMGLRYTRGGFGTPFYGNSEQARVEGDRLVLQRDGSVTSERLTTVNAAAKFLGLEYREAWYAEFHDPLAADDPDATLDVDAVASRALGDWFGFATGVLEELRRTPAAQDVSRVQLWPEHFDLAVEFGVADQGRRASYGASPGDADHPEPYLYVAAWGEVDRSNRYWNDPAFNGASLPYGDLLTADDQFQTALGFLREGHHILDGT